MSHGLLKLRTIAPQLLLFTVAFAWFWFWRPYGFYGGDSEYLDRQIDGGLWFRKREPLAVAAMQLSRLLLQPVTLWPTALCISFASCVAGAVAVVVLWELCREAKSPIHLFILTLASGYALLFHGHIEAYALPTCLLAVWVLAIHRAAQGRSSSGAPALAFAGMAWCHTMALCLSPALLLTAWVHRGRLRRDWRAWGLAGLAFAGLYVFTDVLQMGHGPGFENLPALLSGTGPKEYAPLLSSKHLAVKAHFLWVATHVTFPFALVAVWRTRGHGETLQVAGLVVCGLAFLILFHPDAGYLDWDLFLLPSLPIAVLGARYVAASPRLAFLTILWIAGFLAVWLPRTPVWARLSERGLAEVEIVNFPPQAALKLDDRGHIRRATFKVQGGTHSVSVLQRGERTRWRVFFAAPGERLRIRLPEGSAPAVGGHGLDPQGGV